MPKVATKIAQFAYARFQCSRNPSRLSRKMCSMPLVWQKALLNSLWMGYPPSGISLLYGRKMRYPLQRMTLPLQRLWVILGTSTAMAVINGAFLIATYSIIDTSMKWRDRRLPNEQNTSFEKMVLKVIVCIWNTSWSRMWVRRFAL